VKGNALIGPRFFLAVLLMFVLALGLGWHLVLKPTRSWAAPSDPTLLLSGERIIQASPATADFDRDGDKEIVIGGKDGMLYVISYNGSSWSVVWSRQTTLDLNAAGAPSTCETTDETEISTSVAIADLEGDGRLEIVVTTGGSPAIHRNGGVLVYTYNRAWSFAAVPGWPQPRIDELGAGDGIRDPDGCWDGFSASAAVGDLDGDGDLEVVTEALNRRIYAWEHNGTPVSGWPIRRQNGDTLLRGGTSTPALGDIDGDGLPEVVVGTNSPPWDGYSAPDYSKGTVWAINGDSSSVPGWPVETQNNISSSPALGDIDNDGQLEVVIGSGKTTEGGTGRRVYAWNADGSVVPGWPKVTAGDMPAPPALGDVDGDGDLEIVIGCGAEFDPTPDCTLLYAWHGNGSAVNGFPMTPPSNDPITPDLRGLPYSPVLADYDGDGAVEILVLNTQARGVSTVERNGTPNNDLALQSDATLYSPPLVEDVDNDGMLEVIIVGTDRPGLHGAVYIRDVVADATSALPWPMFHHDVYRSGNIAFYLDNTPPGNPTVTSPTHTPNVWSSDDRVRASWSGASDDESGIGGYYYAWDTSATTTIGRNAAWVNGDVSTLTRELADGASWYFHIRAVNRAGLLAADTVHFGPVKIDTAPPVSMASAPSCAVQSADVSWHGIDAGSGIVSYDVQVREDGSGTWSNWKSGTTGTSGVYTDDTGRVYRFRSLARDRAGNLEGKSDSTYDAETWLAEYGFAGTVHNVRDQGVFLAQVTSVPAVLVLSSTDLDGNYLLCHQDALSYALNASRSDLRALPAMKGLSGTLNGLDFYLPATDDVLTNGQFESGDLGGWTTQVSGSGSSLIGDTPHTGDHAVELQGGFAAGMAALSQSVVVPAALEEPTLSLLYRAGGNQTARVIVQGAEGTLSQRLPAVTAWSHVWLDLSTLQGQTVEVTLELDSPSGGSGWLVVDEVSLGSTVPGVRRVYLPVMLRP
jgi:hypothetical protein